MKSIFFCTIVLISIGAPQIFSAELDPRLERVKGIERNHGNNKIIIHDLFVTDDPSQGVIALLPLSTYSGNKDVLVWIPPKSAESPDSQVQLVELPVDRELIKRRTIDFGLASPDKSIKYRWTAGGQRGFMISRSGQLKLWTRVASKPVIFTRAFADELTSTPHGAWQNLRDRIKEGEWFTSNIFGKVTNKVTLLNSGPIVETTSGLEKYLSELNPNAKFAVVLLRTEHDVSKEKPPEQKLIDGFDTFALVFQVDQKSGQTNFQNSNLVGLSPDGSYKEFPGTGRRQLQEPHAPQVAEYHYGYEIYPGQSYYIEELAFQSIEANHQVGQSLFGRNRWSVIKDFYLTYVHLKTSFDGRTVGGYQTWNLGEFQTDESQMKKLISDSARQRAKNLPNPFVDKISELQTNRPHACLKLFE